MWENLPCPRRWAAKALNAKISHSRRQEHGRCKTCGSLVNHVRWNSLPGLVGDSLGRLPRIGPAKLRSLFCNSECLALNVVVDALRRM